MNEQDPVESILFIAELSEAVPEVDLHGMVRHEAEQAVESLLHEAFLSGESAVRIIHGHGTGSLREAVRLMLSQHPLVERFRDSEQSGQLGSVTVAALSKKT